jgi:cytosine/adenosine deaminase-related metal-dependent hydrolase
VQPARGGSAEIGKGRTVIVRARTVVTMDGAPIEDGAVRIRGNHIVEAGTFSDLEKSPTFSGGQENENNGEAIIDLGESVLLPGLINAHCHLDYTCLRGKIQRSSSFTEWIRAINSEKRKLTAEDYLRSIFAGFSEAQRFGTTSVISLEAFPELIARLEPSPIRTWWCAELIDVTTPGEGDEIVCGAVAGLKAVRNDHAGFGLAPHALFTASAGLYRACAEVAVHEKFLLTTHLAESGEEMEMFLTRSGPLFDFLRSIGRSEDDCGGKTPLAVFLDKLRCRPAQESSTGISLGDSSAGWIIAHLNELAETDFDLLSALPEKFSIAHCPRSHAYFGHKPFEFPQLDAMGFNICLGTDSLASNEDLSLFHEMREFRRLHPDLTPDRILEMVTVNPAKALGVGERLGRLRSGYEADMIAIPFRSGDPYKQIFDFEGDVPWMMVAGKVAKFSRFPLSFSQN